MKQLEKDYGDALRVEYHHHPLSFHDTAAMASMAAHKQGKFFEMVDKLYANMKKQDTASFEGYAKAIGIDVEQFKKDVKDPEVVRYVRMDLEASKTIGVRGTPSIYLNGTKTSARDVPGYKKLIDAEIAAVDKLIGTGLTVHQARNKRIAAAKHQPSKGQKPIANFGQQYLEYIVNRKSTTVDLTPPKPTAAKKSVPAPVPQTVKKAEIFPGDPLKGPLDALVTIVECTDFQ